MQRNATVYGQLCIIVLEVNFINSLSKLKSMCFYLVGISCYPEDGSRNLCSTLCFVVMVTISVNVLIYF